MDNFESFLIGILGGIFLAGFLVLIFVPASTLTQETLDEICAHITNNSVSEGQIVNLNWRSEGDLKCKIPTYDHTQRIIVVNNNDAYSEVSAQ